MAAAATPDESTLAPVDPSFVGCEHYKRKCQVLSACCAKFYTCRFCHDAVEEEAQRDVKKKHAMNRHAVRTMRCMLCGKIQDSARECVGCGAVMGTYFCRLCNLFDDTERGQWHCDGCGICRVGGKDNFFHCDTCGVCVNVSGRAEHKCIADRLRQNCPVCMEDLHTSRKASVFLQCGHSMHQECLRGMLQSGNVRCPFCQTSTVDMRSHWRELDVAVLETPMPPEYRCTWFRILCNDCHKESDARFHVVGLKCGNAACGSYNTRKVGKASDAHAEVEEGQRELLDRLIEDLRVSLAALDAGERREAAAAPAPPAVPDAAPAGGPHAAAVPDAAAAHAAPLYRSVDDVFHILGRESPGFTDAQRAEVLRLLLSNAQLRAILGGGALGALLDGMMEEDDEDEDDEDGDEDDEEDDEEEDEDDDEEGGGDDGFDELQL